MSSSPVLIIGAGPASLTLAHGLQKLGIPFRIFERDGDVTTRPQGYRFRLDSTGADALQEMLSPKAWALFEQSCPTMISGITQLDPLTCVAGERPEHLRRMAKVSGDRTYTVDRTTLRHALLHGLDEHSVCFGKEFASYELSDDNVIAEFTDGTSATGSIIVGADGGSSRVRKQYLPHMEPLDAEGRLIYGKAPLTSEFRKGIDSKALKTMNIVRDQKQTPGVLLLLEAVTFNWDPQCAVPLPDDYIFWVLVAHRDLFAQKGITDEAFSNMAGDEAVRLTASLTETWSPVIRSVFQPQHASQTSTISVRTMDPNLPAWDGAADGRVTLVGDAMHIMPPTGAVGASCAIQDAASLVREISKRGVCSEAIQAYEMEMRERNREPMKRSLMGAKMMYGLDKDVEQLKPATA